VHFKIPTRFWNKDSKSILNQNFIFLNKIFLKATFEKTLNTKLAPNYMLNISKLFALPNKHIYWPNKHNHDIVLFKQAIATSMFQSYVTHVSNQYFTYITCDHECKMMLMLIICSA
jgi:hypothetical protein